MGFSTVYIYFFLFLSLFSVLSEQLTLVWTAEFHGTFISFASVTSKGKCFA